MPLARRVASAVAGHATGRRPLCVLVLGDEHHENEVVATRVLGDESVRLALQRFQCLRSDLGTLPTRDERRAAARHAPALYLLDPAGKLIDALDGNRVRSRTLLLARIRRLWSACYEIPLDTYLRDRRRLRESREALLERHEEIGEAITDCRDARTLAALRDRRAALVEKEEALLAEVRRLIQGPDLKDEFFGAIGPADERPAVPGGLRGGTGR